MAVKIRMDLSSPQVARYLPLADQLADHTRSSVWPLREQTDFSISFSGEVYKCLTVTIYNSQFTTRDGTHCLQRLASRLKIRSFSPCVSQRFSLQLLHHHTSHSQELFSFRIRMFFEPKSKVEEKKLAARVNSRHVHIMSNIYDLIFDSFPPNFGKMASKKERTEKKLYDTSLIYGEIDYDSFGIAILFVFSLFPVSYCLFSHWQQLPSRKLWTYTESLMWAQAGRKGCCRVEEDCSTIWAREWGRL